MRTTFDGFLLSASPFPLALALVLLGSDSGFAEWSAASGAIPAALAWLGSGLTLSRFPRCAVVLFTVGVAGVLFLLSPWLIGSPALTLAIGLTAILAVTAVWRSFWGRRGKREALPFDAAGRTRWAATATLGFALFIESCEVSRDVEVLLLGYATSLCVSLSLAVLWLWKRGRFHPLRSALFLGAIAVTAAGIASERFVLEYAVIWSSFVSAVTIALLPWRTARWLERAAWWEPVLVQPARLLAVTFFALCVAGTAVLLLPPCTTVDGGPGFFDAAFTAVSAVCVTGLIVLDTPGDFSFVGQLAILILIQLGGLGIMTFSAVALRLLGRRMSLRHEGAVAGLVSTEDRGRIFETARAVLLFTAAVEMAGAVALVGPFAAHGDAILQAIWRAVFTSVSAFCNAGFALQTESLVPYRQSGWILHVVATQIILGGLSPAVVLLCLTRLRRPRRPLPPQAKIVLAVTASLLLAGFLFILAVEWNHTLRGLRGLDRLHNAWFQAVTPRTAGFNSLPTESLQPASRTFLALCMFVGGSPGGTAGGIKTTTAAVLLLAVLAAIRGRETVTAFGFHISRRTVYRASAITTAGLLSGLVAILVLQLTQELSPEMAIFEAVSALGTVGLSTGGTERLDTVGKVVIMICMFSGRVGPLTLFMFLTHRVQEPTWRRPETEIEVG